MQPQNIERIDIITEKMVSLWKKHPHMQFGQLVNSVIRFSEVNWPIEYLNNDAFEHSLDKLIDEMNQGHGRKSAVMQLFDA